MAKRTPEEIYAALITAGFPRASATTMTAVALGESGGDDAARGDLGLQTSTWGPSYGLFQIRTIKSETGTGSDRDISHLAGDIDAQAEAAYRISHKGTDFSPWTVFTTGKFQSYMSAAKGAADRLFGLPIIAARKLAGLLTGAKDTAGNAVDFAVDPSGAIIGALGTVVAPATRSVKKIAVEGIGLVLGVALVGAGLVTVARGRR